MPTRTIRRAGTLALALALMSACGSGDDGSGSGSSSDGADTPIGKALTEDLMAEGEDELNATEEEARCAAGGIVDGVGEDRLEELGVTADNVDDIETIDFTDGELDVVVDSLFDCIDVEQMLADEMAGEFGDEAASCVAEELDPDLMKRIFKSEFGDGADEELQSEFFQAFLDVAAECDLPIG